MKKILLTIFIIGALAGCGRLEAKKEARKETRKEAKMVAKEKMNQEITESQVSNKVKVAELLTSIETGAMTPAGYINPEKYTQHNLGVADGMAGFGAVMQALHEHGGGKAEVVRVFQDGDFVFAHTKYDFFGPKIGFDIFKFEDGKIVEHWDNLQELVPVTETASGRSMIDGPTVAIELDKTEENKALVTAFVNDILLGGNHDRSITDFISTEKYIQHNPGVKDGLAGFGEAMQKMAESGMSMVYEKNHIVLAEGDFVLTVSEGQFLGMHTSFYDLFRIQNGKITEHWDVIEEIPAEEKWANKNGKFAF